MLFPSVIPLYTEDVMQQARQMGSPRNPLYIGILFRRRSVILADRTGPVLSDAALRELDERLLRDIGISRWLVEWRNE